MHQEVSGKRLRPMLGTWVSIEARAREPSDLERGLQSGMNAIQRVEQLMHPKGTESDLPRVAGAPPGACTVVDPWTFAVLRMSAHLNLQTDGLFDPCLVQASGRMPDVELREPDLVICHAPVALDLGGIAKGFAIDQAIEALQASGCTSALVNAGGDLRVFGTEPQSIQVRTSGEPLQVELLDRALAVSAPRSSASPSGHLGFYLGTTGAVVSARHVAVVAPLAMIADALCKCALVCAPSILDRLLEQHSAQLLYSG